MLKMGINILDQKINLNSCLGKVWALNNGLFVIHDYFSLNCYNKQISKFLSNIKTCQNDPFQPEVKLD